MARTFLLSTKFFLLVDFENASTYNLRLLLRTLDKHLGRDRGVIPSALFKARQGQERALISNAGVTFNCPFLHFDIAPYCAVPMGKYY